MSDEWYIEDGHKTRGPFLLIEVYELIELGDIGDDAWFELDGERIDLDSLREQWPDPRQATEIPVLEAVEDVPDSETPPTVRSPAASPKPPPERDCILILGRRRAGKTVYLATLYEALWKSMGGLTMKAQAGPTHKMLTGIVDQLRRGHWPEATLGTRHLEFELDDNGVKRTIVAFDYSGEDFRRAFVEDDETSPETAKLMEYLGRAAAAILLIDPAVAVAGDHDEIVDDDFGMVQAVKKIRGCPGGDTAPITVALTKGDRNREVILSAGTKHDFIMRHYPALVRTLGSFIVFTVSAVQEIQNPDGAALPSPESVPLNVDKPFLHCLDQMRRREKKLARRERRHAAKQAKMDQLLAEEAAVRWYNWKTAFLTAGLIVIGLCICVLIWILRTD